MIIIVDIDMTISDARRRLAKAGQEPPKDDQAAYDRWLAKLQPDGGLLKDPVVRPVRELINSIRGVESPAWIYYVTSRSEKHHKATAEWLRRHDFYPGSLFMRKDDDYRSAAEYKEEAVLGIIKLLELSPEESVLFLDDDPGISDVCKRNGWVHLIPVLPDPKKPARRKSVKQAA